MLQQLRLALVSDLHFGSVPKGLAAALSNDIEAQSPHLTIVPGDLTMRARAREFAAAAAWLGALPGDVLVLPGNHDLPYFNPFERFMTPYKRYHGAIGASAKQIYMRDGGIICGVNTTRSWQPHLLWQEGAVRQGDLRASIAALQRHGSGEGLAFKAAVTHHPLYAPASLKRRVYPAIGARAALHSLLEAGVEVFMSGHIHKSFAESFAVNGRDALLIGAPTALSNRLRGEENGYWLMTVTPESVDLQLRQREGMRFTPVREERFPRRMPPRR